MLSLPVAILPNQPDRVEAQRIRRDPPHARPQFDPDGCAGDGDYARIVRPIWKPGEQRLFPDALLQRGVLGDDRNGSDRHVSTVGHAEERQTDRTSPANFQRFTRSRIGHETNREVLPDFEDLDDAGVDLTGCVVRRHETERAVTDDFMGLVKELVGVHGDVEQRFGKLAKAGNIRQPDVCRRRFREGGLADDKASTLTFVESTYVMACRPAPSANTATKIQPKHVLANSTGLSKGDSV